MERPVGRNVTDQELAMRGASPFVIRLRRVRVRRKVTQRTLAKALGVGHATLASVETGRKSLSLEALKRAKAWLRSAKAVTS